MASGVQSSVYPQPPPSFPQHNHSSSMNGPFSQQSLSVYDHGPPMASTPVPTPPPPRPGSQHQMNYHMNGGSMMNGMVPSNSFGNYPEPNTYTQPQYFGNAVKPQIYTAVYSNVSVFEMEVNGVAVMRRRTDGWLNATQILKVAGVDKGKRTKVLEKEILTGEHEKVQGGYGKYQGTWINYRRGREFCRQYGVEQLLLPLLEYDLNTDGMSGGVRQEMETPTKEQAMAAQRKRMYGGENRSMSQSSSGTFFKNMSSTAANAINALNRTRLESPTRMDGRRSAGPRRPLQQQQPHQQQQQQFNQDNLYPGASQQSMQSLQSQDSFGTNGVYSQGASFADFPTVDVQEPPRKRIRPSPQNSFGNAFDGHIDVALRESSPTEPNQSFYSNHNQSFAVARPVYYGLEPLPHPSTPLEEQRKEWLLDLFLDPSRTDFDDHPAFLKLSGEEFELPIDQSCNTALHWAATLARLPLIKKLLEKGFNMRRANSGGETALIAACQARNNMDQNSFPALLTLLGPSIELRDARGRTILHHIAVSSAMKGRASVGRYYLESLLEYVVQQGSTNNTTLSQQGMSFEDKKGMFASAGPMTLARFMSDIVNAQDKTGSTALNLAARTSTTAIIDQLIEIGADPHIPNRAGLAPVDFGVGVDVQPTRDPAATTFDLSAATAQSSQASFENAQENIMTSMREILNNSQQDFESELREKQEILDKTNAALKESATSLTEEKRKLERLQAQTREKEELEQKIKNLRQATSDLRKELSSAGSGDDDDDDDAAGSIPRKVQEGVLIGEADGGLDLDGRLNRIEQLFPSGTYDGISTVALSQEQMGLLSSLERAQVLSGRVTAYQQHNQRLENQVKGLRARSSELEYRYRRIVGLCTGADVDKVDELLDGLVQAVVSEQKEMSSGSELGRIREFLRLVQGTDPSS